MKNFPKKNRTNTRRKRSNFLSVCPPPPPFLLEKNISKIITGSSQLDLNSNENEIENFKQKILSDSNLSEYKDRLIIYPLNLDSVMKFVEKICKHESKIDYLVCYYCY